MAKLTSDVVEKLEKLVRQFVSDDERALLVTTLAIKRMLKGIGFDVYDFAEHLLQPAAKDELKRVYDVGIKKGIEQGLAQSVAQQQVNGNGGPSSGWLGKPSLEEMVRWTNERIDLLLRDKDREFISDVHRRAIWLRGATPKQQAWIEDLYQKTGGKI
jgi:hypothetical protein